VLEPTKNVHEFIIIKREGGEGERGKGKGTESTSTWETEAVHDGTSSSSDKLSSRFEKPTRTPKLRNIMNFHVPLIRFNSRMVRALMDPRVVLNWMPVCPAITPVGTEQTSGHIFILLIVIKLITMEVQIIFHGF
jgi:hypothetical protein